MKLIEEYRRGNTDDNHVLNFFDEMEIHPYTIYPEIDTAEQIMKKITYKIGPPRNYGKSAQEIISEYILAETKRVQRLNN